MDAGLVDVMTTILVSPALAIKKFAASLGALRAVVERAKARWYNDVAARRAGKSFSLGTGCVAISPATEDSRRVCRFTGDAVIPQYNVLRHVLSLCYREMRWDKGFL